MKRLLSIAVLVSVLAVAGVASATTITLREVGVNNREVVNATFGAQINGTYNVYAGYYQLSINDASPVNGFCVDPAWAPSTNQTYNLRAIDINNANDLRYARAAYLFSLAGTPNYAPALIQVAIWETVMGTDFTLVNPTTTFQSQVDALVALSLQIPTTFDLNQYSLAVSPGDATSGYGIGWQDYIVRSPAPVPEPATMLLLGSGFVGLAAFRRRSKK